jgi:hypothetical protein
MVCRIAAFNSRHFELLLSVTLHVAKNVLQMLSVALRGVIRGSEQSNGKFGNHEVLGWLCSLCCATIFPGLCNSIHSAWHSRLQ